MKDLIEILVVGVLVVLLFLGWVFFALSINDNRSMIEECEEELPRTHNCILIAVPEDK